MKYEWIEEYLMKKAGVTKDFQEQWNWIRFFTLPAVTADSPVQRMTE